MLNHRPHTGHAVRSASHTQGLWLEMSSEQPRSLVLQAPLPPAVLPAPVSADAWPLPSVLPPHSTASPALPPGRGEGVVIKLPYAEEGGRHEVQTSILTKPTPPDRPPGPLTPPRRLALTPALLLFPVFPLTVFAALVVLYKQQVFAVSGWPSPALCV